MWPSDGPYWTPSPTGFGGVTRLSGTRSIAGGAGFADGVRSCVPTLLLGWRPLSRRAQRATST
eukprot:7125687-Lingulodinium_polyedra.AAC.1